MATEPIRIPIRNVLKDIENVGPDMQLLVDDGVAMGRAKVNDAIDKRARSVAQHEISELALGTASQAAVEDFATASQGVLADTAVQPGDLADVATSGDYDDLSNKPVLGSAAGSDVGDFATADQGAKADASVLTAPQSLLLSERVQAQANIGVEIITAAMFGAVGDGTTDDSTAIQALFDYRNAGGARIPPGEYYLNEDVIIRGKRIGMSSGYGFEINAAGAQFTGPGRIIIDSCKRVLLSGFYAPETDIVLNGAWWCGFSGIQFRDLICCESAGEAFTENYWNTFTSCLFQSAITAIGTTGGNNAFTFVECSLRGSATQGFTVTRDFALDFARDHLVQGWTFIGGDVSYYNVDIYRVPASNPTREVSVSFIGTYFDQKLPKPTTRPSVRVTTDNCVAGTSNSYSAPLAGATLAPQDMFVASRLFHLTGRGGVNLIPNGDFKERHNGGYTGAGRPLTGTNGSTMTRNAGGPSGWYLNINQPATSSNSVSFRAQATEAGYYSALLVLRNADAGGKTVRVTVFDVNTVAVDISDAEWTVVPFTVTGSMRSPGQNLNLLIHTNDGTPFNVDVAYAGIFLGIGGDLQTPPKRPLRQFHTFAYNAPSIAAGAVHTYAHTVTGAEIGDFVSVSVSDSRHSIVLNAYVATADQVTISFSNPTAAPVDLPSMTYRIMLEKPPY